MKTLLFALLFGGGLIAQTPAYVPTSVLVGYYTSAINQQLLSISTTQFGANGMYHIQILDANNVIKENRKSPLRH